MKALISFALGALLFLALISSANATSGINVGFNVGGSPNGIDADLATLGGHAYINFCCPLDLSRNSIDAANGNTNIRVLRYTASCPTMVMSGCTETQTQIGAFVAANPGLTWELGNEPGNSGQDGGGLGFRQWEVATYDIMKANDPTSVLVGPGILNWPSTNNPYKATSTPIKYDIVAYHIYQGNGCLNSTYVSDGNAITTAAASFGASKSKPVWMTEHSNFWPVCPPLAYEPRHEDEAALLSWMVTKGVGVAIWFTEGDLSGTFGTSYLFDSTGTITPEGQAWSGN